MRYSTYLGGVGSDWGNAVAADADGNAYVTGYTQSADFPVTPGAFDSTKAGNWDAFVTKVNAAGSGLVYSTFLGGSGDFDRGWGIAVNAGGNAVVAGETPSGDFPTTPGAVDTVFGGYSEAFVTELSTDGTSLVYSTYLGGSSFDVGRSVALDANGDAYVTGRTDSANFPVTPGAFDSVYHGNEDAFVAKLVDAGTRLGYATYLGGGGMDMDAVGALEGIDLVYVSGWTDSPDFPTTPGAYDPSFNGWSDVFVSRLNLSMEITLDTVPAGLAVGLDGGVHTSPLVRTCHAGSRHAVDAPSPQGAGTTRYAFANWSDGGGAAHEISCVRPVALTASFTREYRVGIATAPTGLQVTVDGTDVGSPATQWWAEGSGHSLDVPSPQPAGLTRHVFDAWSDGGTKAHPVVASGPVEYLASFVLELQITVATVPSGLEVVVDGSPVTAPQTLWRREGGTLDLDVASPQGNDTTRYVFGDWSDVGARHHAVAVNVPATYTASFDTEYSVTVDTSPSGLRVVVDGVSVTAPATFWWGPGSGHTLRTESPQGLGGSTFEFASWSNGGAREQALTVHGPAVYTARFVEAPSALWAILGVGVAIASAIVVVAFLVIRRRRKRRSG